MSGKKKPLVVVTRKLFDTRLYIDDVPMTMAQLIDAVQTADVLVPTVSDQIDAEILSHANGQLRLLAHIGNGVDNLDVAAAVARDITITTPPQLLTENTTTMNI